MNENLFKLDLLLPIGLLYTVIPSLVLCNCVVNWFSNLIFRRRDPPSGISFRLVSRDNVSSQSSTLGNRM